MLQWIRSLFAYDSVHDWRVEVTEPGTIVDASIEYGVSNEDYSHLLTLRFDTPARDGNDFHQLNIRRDGQIAARREIYSGEQTHSMVITPSNAVYDLLAIDSESNVINTSQIRIFRDST